MKYIVMLGDGMADYSLEELGGKTPLQAAVKPNMDYLAQHGTVGMVKTVPDGMPPQSDTANLSVMGYDPLVYYTGRSPLEAVSMGIELGAADLAFRCNLVCISEEENYEDATMIDYSSDEISTEESTVLINDLNEVFKTAKLNLYPGISYRHCLVLKDEKGGAKLTPPHDITGKPVREYLPAGAHAEVLYDIMRRSHEILKKHPINIARKERGLRPANSCWFWGEGTKPAVSPFYEKYGVKGGVVSAVDLIKGIAICTGMKSIDVPGTTGNVDTDFAAKGKAAIDFLLSGGDFIYVHIEAPDESGHHAAIEDKIFSIEKIDSDILGPIMEALKAAGEDFSVMITPDHPTPIEIQTHSREEVPFVIYRTTGGEVNGAESYDEEQAKATGYYVDKGCKLMNLLVKNELS
ncbi:MAG: cofactor-independent phosphoglycerate mutase [Christensenellaceae bacterium]|nr:cofactor-independent phosphoglycerate mutase [Christensenellaceae bacterium]